MSKFKKYLLEEKAKAEAYLIESSKETKSKTDYIKNAAIGSIVAFRLNFKNRGGLKLTKVISGKVMEIKEDEFIIETRNGLKYGVPYDAIMWVKTGDRWPRGIYEEMKKGSVVIDDVEGEEGLEFGQVEEVEE